MMDSVVHFELPVGDMKRAKAFYETIFGWKLQDMPMPDSSTYVGVYTTAVDEKTRMPLKSGAINGGMIQRDATVSAPVFAINVPSIDERVRQIQLAGGSVVRPKMAILEMGWYCYVKDCEGNVIGLWEDAKKGE